MSDIRDRFIIDATGQSAIDLVISISLYFSAVGILIAQGGGLFFPTTVSATNNPTHADRITNEIITDERYLNGEKNGKLTHAETKAFLQNGGNNLEDELKLSGDISNGVNVTIKARNENTADYLDPGKSREPPRALDPNTNGYVSSSDGYYRASVESQDYDSLAPQTVRKNHATLDGKQVVIVVRLSSGGS